MRDFLIRLCLFLTPLSAVAAETSSFTLGNGMEIVVIEDHRAPVVVHMVWYRVGAADEPPGKSGIAHYLEHLLFKGTDDLAPGEFSEIVAANGGSDNAFTNWDYTAYFQRIAADRLELMMKMEADRMRDLDIRETDVLTERDVVLEERAQRIDSDPGAVFAEQRRAAQYLNHPYGTPIIGWRHEAEALTRDDAIAFYRRYYAPNNAILIVAGDVDPDRVHMLAEQYYGPLEPTHGLTERQRPQEPPQTAERRLTREDDRIGQSYITRTYLVPERDSGSQQDAAALTILAELLGGSPTTSYLAKRLQFDSDIAVYTSAFYGGTTYDDTTFGFVLVPSEGISLADAEAALDQALSDFLSEGIDTDQFARIKMQARAARIYADDNVAALARRYGRAMATGLTLADIEDWPEILQAVTEQDVLEVARQYLTPARSVTGWLVKPEATQ